jgi:hypothetical protein
MGNLGEGIDASTSYRSAYIMIGRRSRYAMAFKEYARSSQSRREPMVGKPEVIAWVLVNAETGEVGFSTNLSDYPTIRELA